MADLTAGRSNAPDAAARLQTTALLEQLKQDVPQERVSFGWIVSYLRARSPETLVVFLALLGTIPGICVPAGILLALFAVAMMSANMHRAVPGFIASRELQSVQLIKAIERSMPVIEWGERFVRPREVMLAEGLRPFAGPAILLLSLTLFVPLPLSNVIPSLAIALIAFASIQADGLLLLLALITAVLSLAISAAAIWATIGVAAWAWA